MEPVVHHVELCVGDGIGTLSKLNSFGFQLYSQRKTSQCTQWVAKLDKIFFVITERVENYAKPNLATQDGIRAEPLTILCCENEDRHRVDTVFNVALTVKNVVAITERIKSAGGSIIQPPTRIEDEDGSVSYSIVRSCCGNVVHTLINVSEYKGPFLPGFKTVEYFDKIEYCSDVFTLNQKVSHIDHVTLACQAGDSERVISFYESCFGMQKFSISRDDDDDEGLILDDGVGLRLRAMEYWRCAEMGLVYHPDKSRERHINSVMLVVVESLPGQSNCNVETFLREHHGPGVEHLALSTNSIFQTVQSLRNLKVKFRQPPAAYYKQLQKVNQIEQIGENLDELEKLGILLDSEVEPGPEKETGKPKYLMQIFAHPLFSPNQTFFIEVIQRSGARGLGAGNIIALVRSIREDERRKAEEKKKKINAEEQKSLRSVC